MTPKNPFPGMNPFFERVWYDAHAVLITYMRDALQESLPADLVVRSEEGVGTVIGQQSGPAYRSDVSVSEPFTLKENAAVAVAPVPSIPLADPIRVLIEEPVERWLEMRDATGRLITVLELLSPANKHDLGREEYLRKRRNFISARVNLVEIDLIRQGASVFPDVVRETMRMKNAAYGTCVFRAAAPNSLEVYPILLRERLPAIRVPLRETDADVILDLQPLIDQCHQRGRYHLLDYATDLEPGFSNEDAAWIDQLLRREKLR